jgi:uncharacterized protein YkwD
MRYLLIVALAVGCGELQPDAPNSKLNAAPNATNQDANVSPNGTTMVDASRWGTDGPQTLIGKSPEGNARCTLNDVVTDDLGSMNSAEVPADPWETTPITDATARCGDDDETLAWRLYNCERIAAGLEPLTCDLRLVWMGREHSLDMIEQDYFRHENRDGETPFDRMDRHGIDWGGGAENLARGPDVLDMHYSWMDSSGHRANILGSFSHVGLGTEADANGLISTAVFLLAP